jgi:hypothetical protein
MKTLVTVLTLTTLIAGVATANAQQQGSDEAAAYALSLRMAAPSAYASARVPATHASGTTGNDLQPGARASAAGASDIRQQCSAEARTRWGTNSQDLQTPRDFAYRTCMFDHGVRDP